jgi:hypothetical protein
MHGINGKREVNETRVCTQRITFGEGLSPVTEV